MARDDLTQIDGEITGMPGGGNYVVTLPNGKLVTAKLCGKMKQFKIRCGIGDAVTVGVSKYDWSRGLIMYRHRKTGPGGSGAPSAPDAR